MFEHPLIHAQAESATMLMADTTITGAVLASGLRLFYSGSRLAVGGERE